MMTSFYNLLKYAATGIASPDMTYYDRMRASTLMGGVVQTLIGIPPLSFKSDGTPLISWSMKGNGSQSGTPAPDNPVMPDFVGVRTVNLAPPYSEWVDGYINGSTGDISPQTASLKEKTSDFIEVEPSTSYTFSRFPEGTQGAWRVAGMYAENKEFISRSGAGSNALTFTTTADTKYVRVCCRTYGSTDNSMLNLGITALPYEPYGWAEKITCAGQTTPVYLGEVPTVRRVKKLVLDGTETVNIWNLQSETLQRFFINLGPSIASKYSNVGLCTHFRVTNTNSAESMRFSLDGNNRYTQIVFIIEQARLSTVDAAGFKAYLASEYSAGTPVTIWYVLAEPATGIVNEPLAKIGDYADELHSEDAAVTIPTVKGQNTLTVDTPIQPSEMTITFKG